MPLLKFLPLVALTFAPPAFAQQLLLNPSFELPYLNGYGGIPGSFVKGWATSGFTALVTPSGPNDVFTIPAATDGNQVFYFDSSTDGINQSVSLRAGTTYTLKFDLSSAILPAYPSYQAPASVNLYVSSPNSSSALGLTFKNFSVPFGTGFVNEMVTFSTTVEGSYNIAVIGNVESPTILDNFSLVAVPEPSSYAVISGLGLLAWGTASRIRRK